MGGRGVRRKEDTVAQSGMEKRRDSGKREGPGEYRREEIGQVLPILFPEYLGKASWPRTRRGQIGEDNRGTREKEYLV